MSIAHTVQMYLTQHHTPFDVVSHQPTVSSLRTANVAHIQPGCIAKAVMLEDDLAHSHFMMVVVPASQHVDLARLSREAGRPVHLASEEDAAGLFADCDAGAIPPLGPAYGVETMWDDSLTQQSELFIEAGDHEHLVQLKTSDLIRLLQDCRHGEFSRPV